MARATSVVFKLQGTFEGVTHVKSRRYGDHIRAPKNSKTPFVMTAALAESLDRLQVCNQFMRPIFRALRPEVYEGGMWSRLVSRQFAELKAGRSLNLACLRGFDCNLQHPLSEVINCHYDFSATVVHNQLHVRVRLDQHPHVADELPRTGYQLRVVAIFRDADGTVHKEVALGPLTKYDSALEAVELPIPVPASGGEYMLLLGVVPHLQAQGATEVMSDSGMLVVEAGVVSRESGVESSESRAESRESGVTSRESDKGSGEVHKLTGLAVEKGKTETGNQAERVENSVAGIESQEAGGGYSLPGAGGKDIQTPVVMEEPVVVDAGYRLQVTGGRDIPVAGYGMSTSSYGGGWTSTYSSMVIGGGLSIGGGESGG